MKLAIIGLGRMGLGIAHRLQEKGHEIIGFSRTEETRDKAKREGIEVYDSIEELLSNLPSLKIVWSMVPSGKPTDEVITSLSILLKERDIIIDGGNSYYKDAILRNQLLEKKGINFLDVGVSGGLFGRIEGYSIMVGGNIQTFSYLEPIFEALSQERGYGYFGKSGSGHFIKMVHNGIEYALMQAYGEGMELLKENKEFDFDIRKICDVWNRGSIIRSWLLELIEDIIRDDNLDEIEGVIEDSGEGRWAVLEGVQKAIPTPAIAISLMQRFLSREDSFSNKIVASLRSKFGGHPLKKKEDG